MDNDLNRSVRLLDEAVSSQSRHLLRRAYGKDKTLDLSVTINPDALKEYIYEETLNYDTTFRSFLDENKTLTGSVIRGHEPWKNTSDSLYEEFFEILQAYADTSETLGLIAELSQCCSDALNVINGLKSKVQVSSKSEELWLENEKNTWKLLYVLYGNRLNQPTPEENTEFDGYYGKSEKYCMLSLFKRDNLVREIQLVIDWLESNAAQKEDEQQPFSYSTIGWENTLHQLKSKDTIVFKSSRQIVNYIDPDAPHYEKLPLHDLDVEDEQRLCRQVFRKIRCGKLAEAQQLCVQCGHAWKAALLEGWKLYHNPYCSDPLDSEFRDEANEAVIMRGDTPLKLTEGNEKRDIWKSTAWKYCDVPTLDTYTKAAVSSYCGKLDTLLHVCHNWEDYLWAYMRNMIDIKVESEIREHIARNYMPLPPNYWEQKKSINEVFEVLETNQSDTVKSEAKIPDHIIQKFIILDELPRLLELIIDWVTEPNVTTQFIRFLTHFLLILEHMGQITNREAVERVTEEYIKRLVDMRQTRLIAFYASKLNESMQVHVYATYLESVTENEERKEALRYGEDCGLNVFAIANAINENVRSRHENIMEGDLQHKITKLDEFKISTLDWLLFNEIQLPDMLRQTNALIFQFLTLRKLDAAQLAFNKLPVDIVKRISQEEGLYQQMEQNIKEYLSYQAYLTAHESFNDWFKQFKSKPIPPRSPAENAPFTEKVAFEHKTSQYKADIGRWKLTIEQRSKVAKASLYNVLLFPDGGWLSGAQDAQYLQAICIPECVLLLYSVLYDSEQYEECVQLADIIVSEKFKLYQVYTSEKLGELFQKLSEASIAQLNQKKDPWGHELSA